MKKYRFLWITLAIVILFAGVGYVGVRYYGSQRKEKPYFGETTVIEKQSFDEFASEIVDLVKEYDGKKIDENALYIPYYSRRLIVQSKGEKLDLTQYGAKIVVQGPDNMYIMQFTTREAAESACHKLQEADKIEYCEPDLYAGGFEESENYEAMSWGVEQIGADDYAQHVRKETKGQITVAVVDSGVYKHSFLKDKIVYGGIDYIDNDMNPDDEHSHGTHVAGTIVDCTQGLNVMILPVRVLGADNKGSTLVISLGVRYAVSQGVQVMNLSLGTYGGTSQTLDNAVLYAAHRGCIVVAAAGNENVDTSNTSPAHLNDCIVVSAVDSRLEKADFSNWGNSVDFAAPGVNVTSCVPQFGFAHAKKDGKKSMDGTSMATPHITALAAMIKLENPAMPSHKIQNVIKKKCVDLGEPGWDSYYGWGIPDFSEKESNVNPKESVVDSEEIIIEETSIEEISEKDLLEQYANVLSEYKMLSGNNFDRSLKEKVLYANEGVWNFCNKEQCSVYYRFEDLADDGEPELLIAIYDDGKPRSIIDIYGIEDGKLTALIESNGTTGYRSLYYLTTDKKIKQYGSGGALNTLFRYYKLSKGSVFLEQEGEYVYDGWNGDKFSYIDSDGNSKDISKEEYRKISSDEDVDFGSEWRILY